MNLIYNKIRIIGAAKPSPKAETACEESAASDPAALPEDSDSAEQ